MTFLLLNNNDIIHIVNDLPDHYLANIITIARRGSLGEAGSVAGLPPPFGPLNPGSIPGPRAVFHCQRTLWLVHWVMLHSLKVPNLSPCSYHPIGSSQFPHSMRVRRHGKNAIRNNRANSRNQIRSMNETNRIKTFNSPVHGLYKIPAQSVSLPPPSL